MNVLVWILRPLFSDLKFVIKLDQFYQICMCFWHQILKVYGQILILIGKFNAQWYQLCFLSFSSALKSGGKPWQILLLYHAFINKSIID